MLDSLKRLFYPDGSGSTETFPLFTSEAAALALINRYVAGMERVTAFALSTVDGTAIIPALIDTWRPVLDPGTPGEYMLSVADVAKLRRLPA
jgi:hypothetical protein